MTPSRRCGGRRWSSTTRSTSVTRTATSFVLRAGRELEKLAEPNIGGAIYGAPIAANGVLFVNSVSELFALSR